MLEIDGERENVSSPISALHVESHQPGREYEQMFLQNDKGGLERIFSVGGIAQYACAESMSAGPQRYVVPNCKAVIYGVEATSPPFWVPRAANNPPSIFC